MAIISNGKSRKMSFMDPDDISVTAYQKTKTCWFWPKKKSFIIYIHLRVLFCLVNKSSVNLVFYNLPPPHTHNFINYRLSPSSEPGINWGGGKSNPKVFQKVILLILQFIPPGTQHGEWFASPCNTSETSLLKMMPRTFLQIICIVRSYGKYIKLQPSNLVAELYTASAKCNNVFLIP